jgi:hypothetical protein
METQRITKHFFGSQHVYSVFAIAHEKFSSP